MDEEDSLVLQLDRDEDREQVDWLGSIEMLLLLVLVPVPLVLLLVDLLIVEVERVDEDVRRDDDDKLGLVDTGDGEDDDELDYFPAQLQVLHLPVLIRRADRPKKAKRYSQCAQGDNESIT